MGQVAVIERQPAIPVPSFSLSDLEHIATTIARGKMFGSQDPYAILTLCMLAQAEGQHPAIVFRDYDIIQGKPSKKAKAMLSDFLAAGGKVVWHKLDDECAEATFSHPAGGEATINWTMARAHKAGLGAKDMWKKYPRQMLRSRTVSEGVSTVFPGATSGLYVPEEVMDFDGGPTARTPPTPQAMRARDMKALPAADPSRVKAEEWAEDVIAGRVEPKKAALDKLSRDHSDLYERVIAAQSDLSPQPAPPLPAEAEPLNNAGDAAAPAKGSLVERMGHVAKGGKAGHQPEGRDISDMGEFEPARAIADRLIADARAGLVRKAYGQAEFEALSEDLRAEVVAAGLGGGE